MVLKLLDIYIKCGKRVAAVTYYNNYSNGLAGSLGISPSIKLKNKYNEIKALDSYVTAKESKIKATLNDYNNKYDHTSIRIV